MTTTRDRTNPTDPATRALLTHATITAELTRITRALPQAIQTLDDNGLRSPTPGGSTSGTSSPTEAAAGRRDTRELNQLVRQLETTLHAIRTTRTTTEAALIEPPHRGPCRVCDGGGQTQPLNHNHMCNKCHQSALRAQKDGVDPAEWRRKRAARYRTQRTSRQQGAA